MKWFTNISVYILLAVLLPVSTCYAYFVFSGQNHDRTQDNPPVLSRSSSEGGSNRMSLSSDTEGPPPGPLHPSLSHRTNPDISEEEGEGEPTPCMNIQNDPIHCLAGNENTEMDCTTSEVEAGEGKGNIKTEVDGTYSVTQGDSVAARTVPKSETTAGLNYDSVKYTLVVDEHAQLELVSLKNCLHGYEHNDDSDAETVYQSANEEEDPEYEEEMMRREQARKQGKDIRKGIKYQYLLVSQLMTYRSTLIIIK